jgi:hypothetical protein
LGITNDVDSGGCVVAGGTVVATGVGALVASAAAVVVWAGGGVVSVIELEMDAPLEEPQPASADTASPAESRWHRFISLPHPRNMRFGRDFGIGG